MNGSMRGPDEVDHIVTRWRTFSLLMLEAVRHLRKQSDRSCLLHLEILDFFLISIGFCFWSINLFFDFYNLRIFRGRFQSELF